MNVVSNQHELEHFLSLAIKVSKQYPVVVSEFIVNAKEKPGNKTYNCNCPWIQTYPFMVKAALKGKIDESKLLIPTLPFRFFERALVKEMTGYFNDKFGISKDEIQQDTAIGYDHALHR